MIEEFVRYQASYYADFADLRPSAETIVAFVEAFKDENLLPTTFHEINNASGNLEPRLRLAASNDTWVIDLETKRIVIARQAVKDKSVSIGHIDEFCAKAADFLDRVPSKFSKKGTRLSLVATALAAEMGEEDMTSLWMKILNPIPYYQDKTIPEWRARHVARVPVEFSWGKEEINVICSVRRVKVVFNDPSVGDNDRIEVMLDVNTFQGNTETRFTGESLREFHGKAQEVCETLLCELGEIAHAEE